MNTLKDYVNFKLTHADKVAEAEGYPLKMENCKKYKKMKQLEIYGNSVQSNIPGYQQLEYIEATGTQYIDTGFVGKTGLEVSMKFMFKDSAQTEATYLLGSYINTTTNNRIYAPYIAAGGYIGIGSGGYYISDYVISLDTIYEVNTQLLSNKISCTINEENIISEEGEFNVDGKGSLYLFSRHLPSHYKLDNFKGRIYYCKIWDNDTLVRDFIPCYRIADGVIGMYDLVNDVFYTNAGTGTFIKGGDDTPTPDAPVEIVSVGEKTKNLIPFPYANMSATHNGVTFTVNNDGTITANGTATGGTAYIIICKAGDNPFPTGTYTMSGVPTADTYMMFSGISVSCTSDQSITFTIEEGQAQNFITCCVYSGRTVNNVVFKPMIQLGNTATPYEPYGKYKIPVVQRGINLFSMAKFAPVNKTVNGITFTTLDDERIHIKGKLEDTTKGAVVYINAYNYINNPVKAGVYRPKPSKYTWNGLTLMFGIKKSDGTGENVNAIHSSTEIEVDGWIQNVYVGVSNAKTEWDDIIELQLMEGNQNLPYEPYIEPVTTNIFLDEPLRKLGDYADYIDFKENKVVRNTCRQTYVGTENWIKSGVFNNTDVFRLDNSVTHLVIHPLWIWSNYIIPRHTIDDYDWLVGEIRFQSNNWIPTKRIYMSLGVSTVEEFKEFLTTKNNEGNPLYIEYPMAEPTEEPLNLNLPKLTAKTTIIEVDTSLASSNAYGKYIKK